MVLQWTEVPVHHSTQSCLCQLYLALQAAHWCLWVWPGGSPLPGLGWQNWYHYLLYQQEFDQGWDSLPSPQTGVPHSLMGCGWKLPCVPLWVNFQYLHQQYSPELHLNYGKAGHHELMPVASLANYNFQLYYRVGRANINVYAFLRVSWPMCAPNTSDTYNQLIAAVV